MIVLGIDIGMTGAVAAIDAHGQCQVHDLPVIVSGKDKRVCGRQLILLLRQLVPADGAALACIEDVRVRAIAGRPMSHATEGQLIRARGAVEAALDIMRMRVEVVQPATWKRHFGLLKQAKGASLETARLLYPDAPLKLAKFHNRAESLLIAHWARGKFA